MSFIGQFFVKADRAVYDLCPYSQILQLKIGLWASHLLVLVKKLFPLCKADYFLLHAPGTFTFFSLSVAVIQLFP